MSTVLIIDKLGLSLFQHPTHGVNAVGLGWAQPSNPGPTEHSNRDILSEISFDYTIILVLVLMLKEHLTVLID